MEKKIHLVHIVGTLNTGGVQRFILNLLTSPEFAHYKQSVICVLSDQGELRQEFEKNNVDIFFCPFIYPHSLNIPSYRLTKWIRQRWVVTFPYRLASLLGRIQADLVHTNITKNINLQAKGVLSLAKVPWVWSIHGSYKPHGVELTRWKRALSLMKDNNACLIFVSSSLLDDFKSRGLSPIPDYTKVIHVGVDDQFFLRVLSNSSKFRQSLQISDDCVLFGSLGRLVDEKGYDILIKAAIALNKDKELAHFLIAGSGPLYNDLSKQISKQGGGNYIHLLGNLDDAAGFLGNLDAFVMPSRSEGFPIALLEALAVGLPCIVTDLGGISEMVGLDSAMLIPSESPEDLESALKKFLNSSVRQFYSYKSVQIAKKYSVKKSALELNETYVTLLHKS